MFKLVRFYSVSSAVALLIVALALSFLYRQTTLDQLIHDTENQSAVLTRSVASTIWVRFAPYIRTASHRPLQPLIFNPETWELHEALAPLAEEPPILKIKIYDIAGLTVYSSDFEQIGESATDNAGFAAAARQGESINELLYKQSFNGVDGHVEYRDVVESYLPIRGFNGEVEGVFELYIDVTDRLSAIERTSRILLAGLLGLFTLLYGGLFFVVRHADRIVTKQYENIERQNTALTEEITQRTRVEAALREARDEAEASSQAKSQFLANMSHELRTPLNAVIGFSEVIENEVLGRVSPPRYREYAADICNAGRHLLALVSNVLDLAKVEAGKMEVNVGPFDIQALAGEAARTVEPECKANGNTLTLDCPASLGRMVSDEDKVRGILINLLGNAAKFTHDGRVELVVRREKTNGRDWTIFQVRDTGVGMENVRIEEMFDEFTQQDSSITRTYGGTGLGLAISRRFATLLRGRIAMESAPDQGTTATLRLPDLELGSHADAAE